jgi:hypothetical protein
MNCGCVLGVAYCTAVLEILQTQGIVAVESA